MVEFLRMLCERVDSGIPTRVNKIRAVKSAQFKDHIDLLRKITAGQHEIIITGNCILARALNPDAAYVNSCGRS